MAAPFHYEIKTDPWTLHRLMREWNIYWLFFNPSGKSWVPRNDGWIEGHLDNFIRRCAYPVGQFVLHIRCDETNHTYKIFYNGKKKRYIA